MARAIIGASSALASLALVPIEALTLARLAVAKSLAGALSVSVTSVVVVLGVSNLRVVHPGQLEGADSVGAITSVVSHTQTPVVVANAEAAVAFTVTTARVVAASRSTSDEGKRESSGEFHF
jgi:hypothetical protein